MDQTESRPVPPNLLVMPDQQAASHQAADLIAQLIRRKPNAVLGLATGGTPVECYRELIRLHREDGLDFAGLTTFNLDEYVGLAAGHPQSFRHFMQQHLFEHVNLDPARTHIPAGVGHDLVRQAAEYERAIHDVGGIDLQLLGIGQNGHIAFNEPGSSVQSRTRLVGLTETTIESNARFFDSAKEVPREAITMGIGTILEAKQILLLAFGDDKSDAVAAALRGPIGADHPASLLRTHPAVTFVVDPAAAKQLRDP